MVVEGLGLEKYLDEHLNSSDSCIRVIKYECPKTTEAEIGLAAHTDHGMIAILYQNQVDGLEVETKTGEWIDVKLKPDQFIVIIGESFLVSCFLFGIFFLNFTTSSLTCLTRTKFSEFSLLLDILMRIFELAGMD